VTFNLTGPATPAAAVAVRPRGQTETTPTPDERSYPLVRVNIPTPPKHGGVAVQTGTLLTVTFAPGSNTSQISDSNGSVQVAWNGGPVHSFTGITTIIVDARKARNDLITFTEPA
jgi:hypothetical protein